MEKNVKYTKKIYNKFAKEYMEKISEGGFYNKYIEIPAVKRLLGGVKGKKVLDCGCAGGTHSIILSNLGAKVFGIDVSKELIKVAIKKNPRAKFYVGDMSKLEFKDNFFDMLFYGLSIHYVKNLNNIFKEAHRVLKPKGKIVISTHHPFAGSLKKIIINGKDKFIFTDYFRNDLVEWKMLPGMKLNTYRRTLSDILNPLVRNAFCITKIIEPRPIKQGEKISPADYAITNKKPSFILIEAGKNILNSEANK